MADFRLRIVFATGCDTSAGLAAAFPHVPFIHAGWALTSLGMFSAGLDASLALAGRPGALRSHWPWLVPVMLAGGAPAPAASHVAPPKKRTPPGAARRRRRTGA